MAGVISLAPDSPNRRLRACRRAAALRLPSKLVGLVTAALAVTGLAAQPPGRQLPSYASGAEPTSEQVGWDARSYAIRLAVDPVGKQVRGHAEIGAAALTPGRRLAVDLDAALAVTAVQVDGAVATFTREGGRLLVTAAESMVAQQTFVLAIKYEGVPRPAVRSPWSGGIRWATTPEGKPWVVTDCRLEGADVWMPCNDRPGDLADSVRCELVVPKGLVAVAVGELESRRGVDADQECFAWGRTGPIATGDLGFCIGPFEQVTQPYQRADGAQVTLSWHVLAAEAAAARRCLPQVCDQLAVYEALVGARPRSASPWQLVQVPPESGGPVGLVAYAGRFGDEQYDPLLNRGTAGALVQQAIALPEWRDAWLGEGLATYLTTLYREARFGAQAYRRDLVRMRAKNVEPLVPSEPRDARAMYLGPSRGHDLVAKSCWVLHTLRWQIGDEAFFAALKDCLQRPDDRPTTLTTAAFVARCSAAAGRNLGGMFAVYLEHAALPRLDGTRAGSLLRLAWHGPGDSPAPLDVPVRVGGREVRVAMVDGRGEVEVGDREFAVDPEERVLLLRGEGLR